MSKDITAKNALKIVELVNEIEEENVQDIPELIGHFKMVMDWADEGFMPKIKLVTESLLEPLSTDPERRTFLEARFTAPQMIKGLCSLREWAIEKL